VSATVSAGGGYDAIIVGGGHNGLVTAAYLARAGLRPLVLEARPDLGGAARTETPWGPDFKVTALSYVMSLMPGQILRDLQLAQHGYHVEPMGPSYISFPDGRSMLLNGDHKDDHAQLSKFSSKDADAFPKYEAWLKGIADVLSPMLMKTPPKVGSRRPGDLMAALRTAWTMRGLDVRGVADTTRLFTMSIADLLDDWFESPEVKGMMSINGVIGTWAGPCEPGTAYVMLHHSIGDVGDGAMNGNMGSWGYPIGGMGAVSAAIASSARSFGAEIRTDSPVERILVRNGKTYGVALQDGTEIRADLVVAATHPQITFLRQLDRRDLPADFVEDIERWKSRSGTVKINLAIEGLPTFTSDPDISPENLSGSVELCDSLEYVEQAFQDARSGKAAERPFSDTVIPSIVDPSLCPEGTHIMSMFTQWVPHTWSSEPHPEELEAYADRVIDGYERLAPGFRNQILHRQVIGPYEMEHDYHLIGGNIFHGELTPEQLFHMRPAPGYADYTTPIAGLYQCSSATHGGGGVTGIAGYLCSSKMLSDRKRRRFRRSS
jgi:phytoene dehydrogenase-like protein